MDPDVLITLVHVEEAPSVKPVNLDYDTAGAGSAGLGFGFGFGSGMSEAGSGRGMQQNKAPNSPGENTDCFGLILLVHACPVALTAIPHKHAAGRSRTRLQTP